MFWTKCVPTQAGHYWCESPQGTRDVLEVRIFTSEPATGPYARQSHNARFVGWKAIIKDGGVFAGYRWSSEPIPYPAEPTVPDEPEPKPKKPRLKRTK
jgi:hypothetical protein